MERQLQYRSLTFDYPSTSFSAIPPQDIASNAPSLQFQSSIRSGETLASETPQMITTPAISSSPTPQWTPSNNGVAQASVPTSSPSSTNTSNTFVTNEQDSNGGWDGMVNGVHAGVVIAIIFGVVVIVILSFWFCCGGRARWAKRHETQRNEAAELPLYNVGGRNTNTQRGVNRAAEGGSDAPPMYAEVAPSEHQSVAGGVRGEAGRMEEEAVISDGKTPLSEIPFEDVVLEREVSESGSSSSASRAFQQRHHGMGGDTRGHNT